MTNKFVYTLIIFLGASLGITSVNALETDKDQPAVISADDVEFDFSTGVRIYRGNVKLDQGTMKLRADKLIVEYKDDVLQRATAYGEPATFQQRPDGKAKDMIGKGKKMELDEVQNIITLTENAFIDNGEGAATGNVITYDMAKDKMKIVGANIKSEGTAEKTPTAAKKSTEAEVTTEKGRSKITISAKDREKAKKATSE